MPTFHRLGERCMPTYHSLIERERERERIYLLTIVWDVSGSHDSSYLF